MIRLFDILLAICALVLFGPLMLIIALVVAIADGRPVLFRQARVSKGGRIFHIVKFRTMNDRCDQNDVLLPDAMRMTKVGRFLRRTRFDELPQIFNILSGSMALIGPRPLLPATILAMGNDGWSRCRVRPGLTGWAQVNGNSLLSDDDKLALDLWYSANRSLSLDLRILAQTVMVAIQGEQQPNQASIRRAHEGHSRGRG